MDFRLGGGYYTFTCMRVVIFAEFQKCHNQLEKWLQNGYVLNPQHESILCRGRLDKIWLGGLVNPAAILTSLKYEKAISCGWDIEHVCSYIILKNTLVLCAVLEFQMLPPLKVLVPRKLLPHSSIRRS